MFKCPINACKVERDVKGDILNHISLFHGLEPNHNDIYEQMMSDFNEADEKCRAQEQENAEEYDYERLEKEMREEYEDQERVRKRKKDRYQERKIAEQRERDEQRKIAEQRKRDERRERKIAEQRKIAAQRKRERKKKMRERIRKRECNKQIMLKKIEILTNMHKLYQCENEIIDSLRELKNMSVTDYNEINKICLNEIEKVLDDVLDADSDSDSDSDSVKSSESVVEYSKICKICFKGEINSVILNCGHQMACIECMDAVYANTINMGRNLICPVCLTVSERYIKTIRM
jgi:flagellar biosynthesis GTPase FlhF